MAISIMNYFTTNSSILIACVLLLAVSLQIFLYSPAISDPPSSSSTLLALSNTKLQEVIKLGEGILNQPEDVAVDKMGILYTATRDGCIKRLHKNGTWDTWWQIDSDALLGLTVTGAGYLIVCDAEKGLLKFSEESVTVLTSHVNGTKIRFADDVVESSDGMLYFSVASTKYSLHNWPLDVLEGNCYGQLLKYDPLLNETTILLENLGFANGVALSADQDFVIVCETWKYRCLKYWLKGDRQGQTEIFIDNLPGGPDNINLAPDGCSFWIALLQLTPSKLKILRTSRISKYLVSAFPKLSKWMVGVREKAMIVNVASDGKKIVKGFEDSTGKVMAFVTSVLEFEQHLYLGNLHSDFIGKLPMPLSTNSM